LLLAAALILPGAAMAQTAIPEFDPQKYCDGMAARIGEMGEYTRLTCLRLEQSSYDQVRGQWNAMPENIRRTCARIASHSADYTSLRVCITSELDARQRNQQFQFRR
jgi:hypothetical protein